MRARKKFTDYIHFIRLIFFVGMSLSVYKLSPQVELWLLCFSFSKLLFWKGMEAAVFTAQVLAYIYQNLLFISFSIRERSQATCLSDKFTLL